MSVEVKNLIKIYGSQRAVDDISFTVKSGEIVGFLGPNGAGKSTTMKIATCYVPPTSGTVKVCGFDVEENPVEVRKHVGYLPEHNPLYLDMYVKEYLEFIGSLHNLSGSALQKRVKEMVDLVGLQLEQGKKIGALSKGYRQRVGLAQALVHNPDVLILDEPTTGLDPNQIQEIRTVIKNIGREKTVIFSTHIMQEVAAICDRVVIINRGKLVADSSVADLESNTKGQRVTIAEFESAADERLLQALPQVKEVKKLEGNSYRIVSAKTEDPRAAISKLAAEQNWILLGLRQEENSLEKVFQQLTK
ncbi:gliding motility-associated ABC transporter ATP-binding subunit GldA [Adhaeribacter terreus]|uniref:Gliding motility-associated ABC transporter ATP-binding subunit GldA n=1 Tax=Adhaeribacter terreus TaxID=529703 RepID=A0ABW0EFR1_9BACT